MHMEGIVNKLIQKEFSSEFDGYETDFVLVMGYKDSKKDLNFHKPKTRLPQKDIFIAI